MERKQAVRALIKNEEGNYLLLREHGYRWTFPGGKIDEGEMPYKAIIRELHEELGITVANPKEAFSIDVRFKKYANYEAAELDGVDWYIHFFIVDVDISKIVIAEPKKCQELHFVSADNFEFYGPYVDYMKEVAWIVKFLEKKRNLFINGR